MIEARGLVKRYRSAIAADDLSFDVRPGTVTGFLGPNGAGKSTTRRRAGRCWFRAT
jgi:ABC-2 type transport system ATP-binding protein